MHGYFVAAALIASLALNVYLLLKILMYQRYGEFWRDNYIRKQDNYSLLEKKYLESINLSLRQSDIIKMLTARAEVVEDLFDASTGVEGIKSGIEKVMGGLRVGHSWRVDLIDANGEPFLTVTSRLIDLEKFKRVEIPLGDEGKAVFYLSSEPTYRNEQRLCTLARIAHKVSQLVKSAEIDTKTSLWNHKHLMEALSAEVAVERRYVRHPLALLFIDIDDFKSLNLIYGHVMVDKVLKRFAEVLMTHFREADTVSRVGGDEFVILLRETTIESGYRVAEKLRRVLSEVKHPEIGNQTISISVGITEYSPEDSVEDMYTRGNMALLRAKKSAGKNRTCRLKRRKGTR